MRNIVLLMAVLAMPVLAQAGNYGMAGCGLGAIVIGNKPGMIQIVAATTNVTFGSQTFGITSGTSECTDGDIISSVDQKSFLKTNRAMVMRDAAIGRGEYIATFATLLGCDAWVQPQFFQIVQQNHKELFASPSDDEVLARVKQAVTQDQTLKSTCVRI
jgi:hypothetical protein